MYVHYTTLDLGPQGTEKQHKTSIDSMRMGLNGKAHAITKNHNCIYIFLP